METAPAMFLPRRCQAARQEAIRCAVDVLADLQPGTDDLSGWLVRVLDENGGLLCSIDVSEAEAARQAEVAAF
jgi:hypothetical protein